MQDHPLLMREIQDFIAKNCDADVTALALQKNKFPHYDWAAVLNQIATKQKAKTKLPTWFAAADILYPSKISMEQTSSEVTARYKSELISGDKLIDVTGGFGVDDYYFAQKVKQVVHCEINPELSSLVAHNFEALQIGNIKCISGDSTETLGQLNETFDWIYIDPSRRNEAKGKVFMLQDCLPNVPELLSFYFRYAPNLMIKTAPILDITAGLSELSAVAAIHIVAVDNDVKELLWLLHNNHKHPIEIIAVNITKEKTDRFVFAVEQTPVPVIYSLPKKYLYEPNAAIMKSGGFDHVATQFGLAKLHQHSHLYTSDMLLPFPGRVFEIENTIGYNKTDMKLFLENKKGNVTTRNFPDSVETIRKKWKIKEGGILYSFFTTGVTNDKIVLLCSKIS